jgi:hypothetical protein
MGNTNEKPRNLDLNVEKANLYLIGFAEHNCKQNWVVVKYKN